MRRFTSDTNTTVTLVLMVWSTVYTVVAVDGIIAIEEDQDSIPLCGKLA